MRISSMLGGGVVFVVGLATAGCSSDEGKSEPVARQAAAITPCDLSAPFDAPEPLIPNVASFTSTFGFAPNFDGVTFSADGSYAFLSGPHISGTSYDILKATFSSGSITAIDVVSTLSATGINDRAPFLRASGSQIFFNRINSGYPANDIYSGTLNMDGTWSVSALGSVVNASANLHDQDPYYVETSGRLYFASERGGSTSKDIYYYDGSTATQLTTGSTAVNVAGVDDYRPVVSEDELTLYFGSTRGGIGGDNNGDIFISQRASTSSAWGTPTNLLTLNSSGREFPVALSADQCTLYFATNEDTGLGNTDLYRLYKARRPETTTNPVTLTLRITGTGSVTTSPFNCSHSGPGTGGTGTCTANAAPNSTATVWASSSALWVGSCTSNGGNPSGDGILTWAKNGICDVVVQ